MRTRKVYVDGNKLYSKEAINPMVQAIGYEAEGQNSCSLLKFDHFNSKVCSGKFEQFYSDNSFVQYTYDQHLKECHCKIVNPDAFLEVIIFLIDPYD